MNKKSISLGVLALATFFSYAQKSDTLKINNLKVVVVSDTKFAQSKEKSGKIIEVICKDISKISSSTSLHKPIIKTSNNKGITPKTTIFKVSNNNANEIIEFSNIRDYGKWCETDIAQNGSWKINIM